MHSDNCDLSGLMDGLGGIDQPSYPMALVKREDEWQVDLLVVHKPVFYVRRGATTFLARQDEIRVLSWLLEKECWIHLVLPQKAH